MVNYTHTNIYMNTYIYGDNLKLSDYLLVKLLRKTEEL